MIAVTSCERRALKKFSSYIKQYSEPFKGSPLAVRLRHTADHKPILSESVTLPDSDIHHLFQPPLIEAISRSIEDIAAEAGEGELIASLQDFSQFDAQKKRYLQISQKINTVRVWGDGPVPKSCHKIDFIPNAHPKISRYWMVLFDSRCCHAILLAKQINKATQFADKKFVGFYSFNPYLVQSIRWRFNLLSCGLCKVVDLWEKSFPMPNLLMRDVENYLKTSSTAPVPVRRPVSHRKLVAA
jgi:hypothetical protein